MNQLILQECLLQMNLVYNIGYFNFEIKKNQKNSQAPTNYKTTSNTILLPLLTLSSIPCNIQSLAYLHIVTLIIEFLAYKTLNKLKRSEKKYKVFILIMSKFG